VCLVQSNSSYLLLFPNNKNYGNCDKLLLSSHRIKSANSKHMQFLRCRDLCPVSYRYDKQPCLRCKLTGISWTAPPPVSFSEFSTVFTAANARALAHKQTIQEGRPSAAGITTLGSDQNWMLVPENRLGKGCDSTVCLLFASKAPPQLTPRVPSNRHQSIFEPCLNVNSPPAA
jgi:hypothetical protein